MLKFENVKVLGIQETVEAMTKAAYGLPGDSYGANVVDEETMNEAPFSYTIGNGDLGTILGSEKCFNVFSTGVTVYANVIADEEKRVFIATYSDIYTLAESVKDEWRKDFIEFMEELPYMKTIMDYFAFCEACENAEDPIDEASERITDMAFDGAGEEELKVAIEASKKVIDENK